MATTTTKVDVQITDNGTLQKITTGANKAADALGGVVSKSKAASKALADTDSGRMGYDQARASGGTGAAGRDFAKQSQGLGGLVRVYATFAANLFAVSAAYNALSRAQDTANLVKGLDQLGAASGRNLGTLAKDIVKATDSAVSLREAMTATAQASAAGMSNKDILRMAEGAKKASQALGVDMPDALSRISRGITKLEPELLDEIGIFVRVDKASQDYAKSIGKPVSALTDLEKRAAFANAALTQVEAKFGEINIDSNPYTQLLASMKNVATDGLNLVNKVLGPLVGMLAQSPTALAGVLAGIGAILLNQALPAISQYRSELRKASQESTEFAQARAAEANAYRRSSIEANTAAFKADLDALAENKLASLDAAQKALEDSKKGKLDKKTKQLLIDPDLLDTTNPKLKEYISHLDAMANKTDKAGNPTKISEKYKNLSTSLQGFIAAQDEYIKQDAIIQAKINAPAAKGTREFELQQRADLLTKASKRSEIVSTAADTANLIGFSNAWKELKTNVNTLNLSPTEKFFTLLRGGTAAATAGIIAMGSKLMAVFGWIGAIVAIGGVFISWLKDNEKQSAAASEALDKLGQASDSAGRTLERMTKLSPLENLSPDSIIARANALDELTTAVESAISKVDTEIASRDWNDSILASISGLFGMNAESYLAEQLTEATIKAIELAGSDPKLQQAKKDLLSVVGSGGTKGLEKGLDSGKVDKNILRNRIKDLNDLSKQSKLINSEAIASAQGLAKAQRDVLNSFGSTDPVTSFGIAMVKASNNMTEALKDPITNMGVLLDNAEALSRTGLLPERGLTNVLDTLRDSHTQYAMLIKDAEEYTNKIKEASTQLENTNKAQNTLGRGTGSSSSGMGMVQLPAQPDPEAQKRIDDLKYLQKQASSDAAEMQKRMIDATNYLRQAAVDGFTKGAALAGQRLQSSLVAAQSSLQAAKNRGFENTEAGIREKAEAEQRQITVQQNVVSTMQDIFLSGNRAADSLGLVAAQATLAQAAIEQQKDSQGRFNGGVDANGRANIAGGGRGISGQNAAVDNATQQVLYYSFKRAIEDSQDPIGALSDRVSALRKENSPQSNTLANQLQANFADVEKLAGLKNQQKILALQKQESKVNEARSQELRKVAEAQAEIDRLTSIELASRNSSLDIQKKSSSISDRNIILAEEETGYIQLGTEYTKDQIALYDRLNQARESKDPSKIKGVEKELADRNKVYNAALANLEINTQANLLLLDQKDSVADTTRYLQLQNMSSKETLDIRTSELEAQQLSLDYAAQNGTLNEDVIKDRTAQLSLAQAIAEAEYDRVVAITAYATKANEIGSKLTSPDVGVREEANKELDLAKRELGDRLSGISRVVDAEKTRVKALSEQKSLTTQLNAETNKFAGDFADAMFEATQSGKYDFSSMVNSMISDLGRLIWKQSMMNLYQGSSMQSGISGFFGKLLGAPTATSTEVLPQLLGEGTYAKGGAFSSGVEMFAKGGTFSNQVVSSPTLFKFAKGTGMMGEAGPEAIMPLKRDANGRLGVSGGSQGSTQVVVNNYSGQEVETKESVDSRGQRKIEVSIGNMVAGEIMRSGSMAQQSIKNTFGSKPQLIRR